MTRQLTRRAEEALLGGGVLRPAQLSSLRWLPPGAFSRPAHGALWRLLHTSDLTRVPHAEIPAAVAAAVDTLEDKGLRTLLAPARIQALAQSCPDPRSAPLYGGMVLDAALHRSVEQSGLRLRDVAARTPAEEVPQALHHAHETQQRLEALAHAWHTAPETVRNLLDTPEAVAEVGARPERVHTEPAAEREAVLGLHTRPEDLHDVTRWLEPSDFSDPQLGAAYEAMTTLADRQAPIDALTVGWEASRQGHPLADSTLDALDVGGTCGVAASEQVLATSCRDHVDEAGHYLRGLGRASNHPPSALIERAEHGLRPLATDRERLEHTERSRDLDPADAEPAPSASPIHHTDEEIDL